MTHWLQKFLCYEVCNLVQSGDETDLVWPVFWNPGTLIFYAKLLEILVTATLIFPPQESKWLLSKQNFSFMKIHNIVGN